MCSQHGTKSMVNVILLKPHVTKLLQEEATPRPVECRFCGWLDIHQNAFPTRNSFLKYGWFAVPLSVLEIGLSHHFSHGNMNVQSWGCWKLEWFLRYRWRSGEPADGCSHMALAKFSEAVARFLSCLHIGWGLNRSDFINFPFPDSRFWSAEIGWVNRLHSYSLYIHCFRTKWCVHPHEDVCDGLHGFVLKYHTPESSESIDFISSFHASKQPNFGFKWFKSSIFSLSIGGKKTCRAGCRTWQKLWRSRALQWSAQHALVHGFGPRNALDWKYRVVLLHIYTYIYILYIYIHTYIYNPMIDEQFWRMPNFLANPDGANLPCFARHCDIVTLWWISIDSSVLGPRRAMNAIIIGPNHDSSPMVVRDSPVFFCQTISWTIGNPWET